mgnify:CR=1 FL=1
MDPWTIALLLVMLPVVDIAPTAEAASFQALKDVAHLLDLWANTGHWGDHYASEVRWVQQAAADCYQAPHVGDAQRLPSWDAITARIAFSEQHECWLLDRQWGRFYARADLELALSETRRLRHPWELMLLARNENEVHNLRLRRVALKRLRECIGEEAYYSSQWPLWVPPANFGR